MLVTLLTVAIVILSNNYPSDKITFQKHFSHQWKAVNNEIILGWSDKRSEMIDDMGDTDGCPQISVTFHIYGDSSRMMSREKRSRNVNLFINQYSRIQKNRYSWLVNWAMIMFSMHWWWGMNVVFQQKKRIVTTNLQKVQCTGEINSCTIRFRAHVCPHTLS